MLFILFWISIFQSGIIFLWTEKIYLSNFSNSRLVIMKCFSLSFSQGIFIWGQYCNSIFFNGRFLQHCKMALQYCLILVIILRSSWLLFLVYWLCLRNAGLTESEFMSFITLEHACIFSLLIISSPSSLCSTFGHILLVFKLCPVSQYSSPWAFVEIFALPV